MRRLSLPRVLALVAFAGLVALASADCTSARTYVNCVGLCESVSPCNDTYDECLTFCNAQREKCERVGHPSAFTAFVSCTQDAGFSCNDAGEPIANPPCGPEQAELVQCDSNDAAPLAIPDGSYDAAQGCVDASSCLSCCKELWPKGAREYASAVTACLCGEGGQCQHACATTVCAPTRPEMPDSGDKCDMCLTAAIDEQAAEVGPCVIPVTKTCNGNVDCALYVNCVSQSGCTN